jgi:hypothetical protein
MSDDMDPKEKALLEDRAEVKTNLLIDDVIESGLAPLDTIATMLSAMLDRLDRLQSSAEADAFVARLQANRIERAYGAATTEADRVLVDGHTKTLLVTVAQAPVQAGRPPVLVATLLQNMALGIMQGIGGEAEVKRWVEYVQRSVHKKLNVPMPPAGHA